MGHVTQMGHVSSKWDMCHPNGTYVIQMGHMSPKWDIRDLKMFWILARRVHTKIISIYVDNTKTIKLSCNHNINTKCFCIDFWGM